RPSAPRRWAFWHSFCGPPAVEMLPNARGRGGAQAPLPMPPDARPIGDQVPAPGRFIDLVSTQTQHLLGLAEPPLPIALRGQGPVEAGAILRRQTHPQRRARPLLLRVHEAPAPPMG